MQSEYCKNLVVESTIKGDYTDWRVSVISFSAVVMFYEVKENKSSMNLFYISQQNQVTYGPLLQPEI